MNAVGWFRDLIHDRIRALALLIVVCFASVLMLSSQSRASYATYVLAIAVLATAPAWRDVFQLRLLRWVLALLLWLSLSTLWSDPWSLRDAVSVWTRALLIFCFVVAFAECHWRGELRSWMGITLTVVGAAATLIAIVNFFWTQPADGRLNGMGQLDTHVVAGLVYGVALIFVLDQLFTREHNLALKALLVAVVLIMATAIALTDSRNAWVSVAAAAGLFVASHRIRDRTRLVVVLVTMAVCLGAMLLVLGLNEQTRELILPRGDSFRLVIWSNIAERVAAHGPLFGVGITTSDDVQVNGIGFQHPHNMYLAVLYQGGLVGLALFAVVTYQTGIRLLRSLDRPEAKLGAAVLLLALTSYLLDGHELIDKVGDTWFLYWLPVAIALGYEWSATDSELN